MVKIDLQPSFTNDLVCPPGPVQFYGQSNCQQINNLTWNWVFGDGFNGYEQNPIHTYPTNANNIYNYNVYLTLANGEESCTTTIMQTLDFIKAPDKPVMIGNPNNCDLECKYVVENPDSHLLYSWSMVPPG